MKEIYTAKVKISRRERREIGRLINAAAAANAVLSTGSVAAAAELLGVSRSTLWRWRTAKRTQ